MLSTAFPIHFVEEMLRKTFKSYPFVPVVTQLKRGFEPKKWTSKCGQHLSWFILLKKWWEKPSKAVFLCLLSHSSKEVLNQKNGHLNVVNNFPDPMCQRNAWKNLQKLSFCACCHTAQKRFWAKKSGHLNVVNIFPDSFCWRNAEKNLQKLSFCACCNTA